MEEDEDDFYGGGDAPNGDHEMSGQSEQVIKVEDQHMSDDEEEEDSDDDVQFTIEKPDVLKTEPSTQTRVSKSIPIESSSSQTSKAARQTTVAVKQGSAEPLATRSELLHNGREGKDFPEHRTSDIDLAENPIWPEDGKKITELDIDADLAEHSKPWRLPGTDVTDFFNYGFDEYTWTQYCAKQQTMANTITDLKEEDAKLKSMLGGMPAMDGGMPDMNAMMQMMMGGMAGGDPSKMDFSQMMGMGMPSGQAFGATGGNSPLPQPGQGFQGMNDFGAQMMQDQQQAPPPNQGHGGGSGRGRGRRGRGYY